MICALLYALTSGIAHAGELVFTPSTPAGASAPEPDEIPRRYELDIREAYHQMLGSGVAVGDIDLDGDLDIVLPGAPGVQDMLYRNQLVPEGATGWSLETLPTSADPWRRSAVIADVNSDHLPDIILHGNGREGAAGSLALLQTSEGEWEQQVLPGTTPSATSTVAFDFDGDGRIETLRLTWAVDAVLDNGEIVQTGPLDSSTHLDIYEVSPSAYLLSMQSSIAEFKRTFMQVAIAAFASESIFEVLITKDFGPNLLLRPASDGQFIDIARALEMDVANSDMGIAVGDVDEDGDLDVFITNIFNVVPGITDLYRNTLHFNELDDELEPGFSEDAVARGVSATDWAWSSYFVDLDHDGILDLLVASGSARFARLVGLPDHPIAYTPNYLFLGTEGNSFEPLLGTPLDDEFDSRVALPADLDRDGDLDIVEIHMDAPPRILLNESEGLPPVLHLNLEPDAAAWGARIRADYGERQLRRDVVPGEGYLSQAPPELRVPMALDEANLEAVELRWRDGHITTFSTIPNTGIYRLRKPVCDDSGCVSSPGWSCVATSEASSACSFEGTLSWQEQYEIENDTTPPPDQAEADLDVGEPTPLPRADESGCSHAPGRAPLCGLAALALVALCVRKIPRAHDGPFRVALKRSSRHYRHVASTRDHTPPCQGENRHSARCTRVDSFSEDAHHRRR